MKTNLEIKICGLSTNDSIDAVVAGGASHMGLIFFEKSPRHVSLDQAKSLSNHVAGRIKKVAVSVNADDGYLTAIVEATQPDILQLHGNEPVERVAELKAHFGLPVMKAFAISEVSDFEKLHPYVGIADKFLFDAKPPKGSDLPGGNGVAFDWEIMDALPSNVSYMLSGGLDASNICEAIKRSGTNAVDISSGVESTAGVKDIKLIEEFLAACHACDAVELG